MNIKLDLLDDVRVASPCSAEWDEMRGDDRVRHCEHCDKNVYNIAEMTRQEAIDLLTGGGQTPCLRIYRRKDGKVLTSDCPIGVRLRIRARRWVAAIAGFVGVAISASSGCMGVPVNGLRTCPKDDRSSNRSDSEIEAPTPQLDERQTGQIKSMTDTSRDTAKHDAKPENQ